MQLHMFMNYTKHDFIIVWLTVFF